MLLWRSVTCTLAICALTFTGSHAKGSQDFPVDLDFASKLDHRIPKSYISDGQHLLGNGTSDSTSVLLEVSTTAKSIQLQQFREEDDWKNSLALPFLSSVTRQSLPRVFTAWLRCYLMCNVLYFVTGGMWAYYVYLCWGNKLFADGSMPAAADMWEQIKLLGTVYKQIKVSFLSMPLYSVLPAITEHAVERGWTKSYTRISDVGVGWYLAYFVMYMACVEYFVYWMHRGLHDVKIGYRVLHYIHHKYNKEHTLSPFAGLAFHPLDGILQALPYCWMLFFVPMHFLTFELLLFATGIWTTNIHDCVHAKVAPVMGAGYHTLHHTVYNKNYGHYFIYMDKLHGTLFTPEEDEARKVQRKQ